MLAAKKTTPTLIEKVVKFEDKNFLKKKYTEISEIIEDEMPSIKSIAHHYDRKTIVGVLFMALNNALNSYFSIEVDKKTVGLVAEELILDKYMSARLTIQDIPLALKEAAKTEEVYNRLDFNRIWKFLSIHAEKVGTTYAAINYKKKQKNLGESGFKSKEFLKLKDNLNPDKVEEQHKEDGFLANCRWAYYQKPKEDRPETLEEYIEQRRKKLKK